MNNYPYTYNTIAGAIEHGIQFLFISRGKVNIIKAVRYVYALDLKGKPVYNLAFGDYDFRTDTFVDDQTSNNGDTWTTNSMEGQWIMKTKYLRKSIKKTTSIPALS